MPHIVAEKVALYSAATDLDLTRLLVCDILADHQALVALIAEMDAAPTGFAAATGAAAAQALFTTHWPKR